jgi:SNF2 family DNA or RNA helicase
MRTNRTASPFCPLAAVPAHHLLLPLPPAADVLEEFRAAAQTHKDSPNLAWDLLIVDEAHNLARAPLGKESELSRLLGQLAPYFEHKLFLSATPHNGHTRSFSGLLERLDPVRFTRTSEMSDSERKRVRDVNVRRLKFEINALSEPCFMIKNWGSGNLAQVEIDQTKQTGRQMRQGIIRDTDGTRTMVMWLPQTSTHATSYKILPVSEAPLPGG